jgi:hypothetical protein
MLQEASPAEASKGCHCGAAKTGEPCTHDSLKPPQHDATAASCAKLSITATAAGAPPPQGSLLLRPGQFSTGLCECASGPQAAFICATATALPCFAHGIVWDSARGGGQKAPCARYAALGFLPLLWPAADVGCVWSFTGRWMSGLWARKLLRDKYGLPLDYYAGVLLEFATRMDAMLHCQALAVYGKHCMLQARPVPVRCDARRRTRLAVHHDKKTLASQISARTTGATRARWRRRCGTSATARARS